MEKLSNQAIATGLKGLTDWHYEDNALAADFGFKDFFQAFSFMIKVATEAERAEHHPDWSNVYNKVHIKLSTHEAGGVTAKDIDLAKAITALK